MMTAANQKPRHALDAVAVLTPSRPARS